MQNPDDLAASESALTNAIANYFAASAFIRARPASATNRLFELDANDAAKEAEFRTDLTNVLLSLNTPTEFDTNKVSSTIYAGAYFSGTHSLRSLMPQFNGDSYVNDSLPDYTFGGIFPYQPAYKTEKMLRDEFYSYAGIYGGLVYDINYSDPSAGVFGVTRGAWASTSSRSARGGPQCARPSARSAGASSGPSAPHRRSRARRPAQRRSSTAASARWHRGQAPPR